MRRAHTGGRTFRLRILASHGSWPRRKQPGVIIRPRQPGGNTAPGYFVTRLSVANCAHLHRRELHAVHTDASDKAALDPFKGSASIRANRAVRAQEL